MSAEAFKAARDFLFAHRADYPTAHRDFRWPNLDTFNYALDWFDGELARGALANQPALTITGAGAATRSFAELSAASSRLANGLRSLGVKRGDRILLMLGNVVPLWEIHARRHEARRRRDPGHHAADAARPEGPVRPRPRAPPDRRRRRCARSSTAWIPSVTRIAVGDAPAGWHRYDDAAERARSLHAGRPDQGHRPAAAVFHLRHHVPPEAGGAQPPELPGRPPDHDVLDRPAARRHAPEHLLARLGEARLQLLLRAVERRRHGVHRQPAALQRPRHAGRHRREQRHHALRPAHRVAHVRAGGPDVHPHVAARTLLRRRAAESRRSSSTSRKSGARRCARPTARPKPQCRSAVSPDRR